MQTSRKYCRTLHAHVSLGSTSDDRFMPEGYIQAFAKTDLVLTEKLDGQNNCLSKTGVFARSHAAVSVHPWDEPLRARWQLIKNDLGDLEIFGENVYGVHSIEYQKLESYFYVFAIREGNYWLSWEEVQFYASLLDFPTVPVIQIEHALAGFVKDDKRDDALNDWLSANLGMTWLDYVQGPGQLAGLDTKTRHPAAEGFVIRTAEGFISNQGRLSVAANEFDSIFKIVRAGHVQTDVHWTKTWQPAKLCNYSRFGWDAYQYLSR